MSRRVVAVALAALVVCSTASVAVAQQSGTVVGRPNLELAASENRFEAGERATLNVFVSNDGDLDRGGPAQFEQRVTTARNVQLEIVESELSRRLARGLDVRSGPVFAGSVPEGTSGPFAFELELDESLAPGTYQVPVEVSYDYSNYVEYSDTDAPEYGDQSRTETKEVTIVVENQPSFSVTPLPGQRVSAGDTTSYQFNVTNTGTQTATNAEVALSAANTAVFFGSLTSPQQATSVFVPRLEPGESETVTVTVGASADTAPGLYLVDARVRYRNPAGVESQSKPLRLGVTVGGEQSFEVRGVVADLRVGQRGTVTGEVVNTGNETVSDAVVVLGANAAGIQPRETEFAVGRLAPGESKPFSFSVEVSNATDSGPRSIPFRVRYRNENGDRRTSDVVDARVSVADEQTFALRNVGSDLRVGESGLVRGTVVNTGNETVSNASVVLRTNNPSLQPRETEYAVGSLAPGASATFEFRVDVPADAEPGPRSVSVAVRYRDRENEPRQSDTFDAQVRVAPEQSFAVNGVESEIRVSDTGVVSGTVTNTGDQPVENAVVLFDPANANIQPRETEYAVGSLEPGASVPFEFTVDVPNATDPGPREVSFRVRYRDEGGDVRLSDALDARVAIGEQLRFAARNVTADLAVGDTGEVTGDIVNTGNETVENAVVLFETGEETLQPRETEYAVDRLEPGESVPFEFTVDVTSEAEPGPRLTTFRVRYRNDQNEIRVSDSVDARVVVGEETDEFRVESLNATVEAGESSVVALRVTNTANETLRNVEAKLFTNDPLSSDSDEGFVPVLEPGESARLRFSVSAAGSALPKTYPLSVDFTYEDERGDTVLSDTYRVPIEVVERERDGIFGGFTDPLLAGGVLLGVVVAAAAVVWLKRDSLADRLG